MAVIFCIEEIDRVQRRARTGEEINNKGIWLVCDEETNSIMDGIKRLWEREYLVIKYLS